MSGGRPSKRVLRLAICFPFPRIVFDGALLKRKSAVKRVGCLFDEHLSWAGVIQDIAKKTRRRLGMLTRLRPLLGNKNMYTTFIRPMMEYGSVQFMGMYRLTWHN